MNIDFVALEMRVGLVCKTTFLKLKPCFDSILLNKQGVNFVGVPPLDLH